MTMRPLQNQATDIAVFVLSVALLGFVTKMVRDVTTDAMGGDVSPSLLPMTTRHTYTDVHIFARAKEYFGSTTNPNEAGYILPDGVMLDFSGKKIRAPSRAPRGPYPDGPGNTRIGPPGNYFCLAGR